MMHRDAFVGNVRNETGWKTMSGNRAVIIHAVVAVAELDLSLQ